MESSVFFKFKSNKEPTRVEFDGTGISVFELKREIILKSALGDGTDFDLIIAADEGMKEVYDDDTTIIPRSTTVIARRMPAKVQGRGGAARYVSGKMPVHAKNSSRKEQPIVKALAKPVGNPVVQLNSAMTEEEKMAAVFQAQTENFTAREEEMATQQYVAKSGPKKPANVPDHDPPQGYICYRCGEKGHWIQLCPTNDNPDYDNRPRVKRTTGIPKSFLKTVDKATALGQTGDGDETKTPSGIMVNADGEFVIAEPDKASWEQFQAKAKSNSAAQKATPEGDKEIQERGLECPIDHKLFIDPMKTPCCEKTYCNDCITNALIESDFICPGCKSDGILIDDLKADEEAVEKIKAFLAEKNSKAKEGSQSPGSPNSPTAAKSPTSTDTPAVQTTTEDTKPKCKSPTPTDTAPSASQQPSQQQTSQASSAASMQSGSTGQTTPPTQANREERSQQVSKKRPAEHALENPKIPKAPKAMQQKAQQTQQQAMMEQMMGGMPGMPGINGMNAMNCMPQMFPAMPMMGNFGGMGMPNMNMGMMNHMMNPMLAGGMGPGFPPMNGGMGPGGFPGGPGGMPNGNNPGMWNNGGMGMNGHGGVSNGPNMGGTMRAGGGRMNVMNQAAGMGMHNGGGYQGQQHQFKNFSHQPADDDDAYFRKPVNPHRHQNRQRRVRPSDYREL
ncbi:DWNN domain-containing protein [Neurospora crassa]|nr:DWNN domain-containing protein [Neurospora crassa]